MGIRKTWTMDQIKIPGEPEVGGLCRRQSSVFAGGCTVAVLTSALAIIILRKGDRVHKDQDRDQKMAVMES